MTGAQWRQELAGYCTAVVTTTAGGKQLLLKWNAMTAGCANDAAILALPQIVAAGWTEADLTAFKYAIGVFQDLDNVLNAGADVSTFNRLGYLVPFM